MRTYMLIALMLGISGVAFAGPKPKVFIRIGESRHNDPVIRIQPVVMTNVMVEVKMVETVEEVNQKPKENYRYKRPVHPKKLYKDVLICKNGYCRVVRVFNQ